MGYKGKICTKVETDFSMTLLQAVSKGIIEKNLHDYIKFVYKYITEKKETQFPLTIQHICSSHTLKTGLRKAKEFFSDPEHIRVCGFSLTMLIHSQSLDEAAKFFRFIIVVFGFTKKANNFEESLFNLLQYEISETDLLILSKCNDETETDYESYKYAQEDINEYESHYSYNPFYIEFRKIYDKEMLRKHEVACGSEKNDMYSEGWILYLLNFFLPKFPLWSAILIQELDKIRDSNASIENFFKILKYQYFNGVENIPAPRFIQEFEKLLRGLLLQRIYPLETTNQLEKRKKLEKAENDKKEEYTESKTSNLKGVKAKRIKKERNNNNEEEDEDLVEEYWCKKKGNGKRPSKNLFFKIPKFITSKKVEKNCVYPQTEILENKLNIKDIEKEMFPKLLSDEVEFPPNFPEIQTTISNMIINSENFSTLIDNAWLDDAITNSYFSILTKMNNNVLSFETFFTSKLQQGQLSCGFQKWAFKKELHLYPVWLIPVHDERRQHWTLLIVDFINEAFIHLDSMLKNVSTALIDRYITFISTYCKTNHIKINWKNWKLYCPTDIPDQKINRHQLSGNCGVHVCLWGYMICTGLVSLFTDKDMLKVRKHIANENNASEIATKQTKIQETIRLKIFEEESKRVKRII